MYSSMTVHGWSDMVDLIRKREVHWRQIRSGRAEELDGIAASTDAEQPEFERAGTSAPAGDRASTVRSYIPG